MSVSPSPPSAAAGERGEATKALRGNLYTGAERRRLAPELLVPSRTRGYLQVIGNVGVFVTLLALAASATAVWQMVVLYVAIGLAMHRLFFPTHDCIHYSLFPTKLENRVCGVILSALLGTSFEAIRDQHLEHHRDFGTQEDPGASDYFVNFRARGEFLIFILGPLVGSILVAKIGDYVLRPSRAPAPSVPSARAKVTVTSRLLRYGAILLVQGGVCALLTRGFRLGHLWRYPVFNVLPAVTVFLFLVRLRMFLEHGALDYSICNYFERKRPTARTIYASWPERVLLCGSDFNFHHEHHLYPVVPGWKLPTLHRELKAAGLDAEDVRRSYLEALAEISAKPWRAGAAHFGGGGSRRSSRLSVFATMNFGRCLTSSKILPMYSAMNARLTRVIEPRNSETTMSVDAARDVGPQDAADDLDTMASAASSDTASAPNEMSSSGTYEKEKMPFLAQRTFASRLFVERPNMRSGRT